MLVIHTQLSVRSLKINVVQLHFWPLQCDHHTASLVYWCIRAGPGRRDPGQAMMAERDKEGGGKWDWRE